MLSPYRVIDLADDRGIFCGRVLADLGAEVIKVEPTAGDPARHIGPFHHDEPGVESSLFWQLYAANKKSVALDIESDAAREALRRLIASADFLVESFRPGYLDALGLGYDDVHAINPALVYVSITPFGQDGPYRDFAATDLTGSALSGFAYLTGDPDRPPLRVSVPQFWTLGGAAGAAGAMTAHAHRINTGHGQHVDVSCQQALTRTLSHAPQFWDMNEIILKRSGPFRPIGDGRNLRVNFECADGYVNYIQPGGATGGRGMAALCEWMDEHGEGHPLLSGTDFGAYGFGQLPDDVLDAMSETLEAVLPLPHEALPLRGGDQTARPPLPRQRPRRRLLLPPARGARLLPRDRGARRRRDDDPRPVGEVERAPLAAPPRAEARRAHGGSAHRPRSSRRTR